MKLSSQPSLPNPMRKMRKNGLLFLGIAVALGANMPVANAFSLISRSTNINIRFTDPAFLDANATYLAVATTQANPQDQLALQVELPTYAQNYAFGISGTTTITASSQNLTTYNYQLSSTGGAGMFGWRYTTPVATDPNAGFAESLIVRSNNGNWDLVFVDAEYTSGALQTTSAFELAIAISGNWSNLGTGANQTEFLQINPGYTIVNNFVYNPASNQTEFRAVSNNWDGSPAAGLSFVLHGQAQSAAVPEPTTVLGAVFGGMGLYGLRRQKARQRQKNS